MFYFEFYLFSQFIRFMNLLVITAIQTSLGIGMRGVIKFNSGWFICQKHYVNGTYLYKSKFLLLTFSFKLSEIVQLGNPPGCVESDKVHLNVQSPKIPPIFGLSSSTSSHRNYLHGVALYWPFLCKQVSALWREGTYPLERFGDI